jgi:hypothetical protein
MSQGLKNLQTAARSSARRERRLDAEGIAMKEPELPGSGLAVPTFGASSEIRESKLDPKNSEEKEPDIEPRLATIGISSARLKPDPTLVPSIKISSSPVISANESEVCVSLLNTLSTYLKGFFRSKLLNGHRRLEWICVGNLLIVSLQF